MEQAEQNAVAGLLSPEEYRKRAAAAAKTKKPERDPEEVSPATTPRFRSAILRESSFVRLFFASVTVVVHYCASRW